METLLLCVKIYLVLFNLMLVYVLHTQGEPTPANKFLIFSFILSTLYICKV